MAHLEPLPEPISFETAEAGTYITASHRVLLDFYLGDAPRRFMDEFIVLDLLSEDLIIGVTTMQKWSIKLDFENEEIIYERRMHRLRI